MFRLPHKFLRCTLRRRRASPVRHFADLNAQLVDSNDKLEEETLPWYSQDSFYSVKIGEVFQSRYQVIGKLGFGGYSTVWLSRDLQQHKEFDAYKLLDATHSSHDGATLVRTALDSFHIGGADRSFQCLVHKPLGISLLDLRLQSAKKVLPQKILKLTLLHLLLALDYLHTQAGIIHTDIQEKNIMLGIEDDSILVDFERAEKSNPSPRKIVGDRVIYSSRQLPKTKQHGRPVLCDFGQARFGLASYSGDIQPRIYRAPEVVLRMSWDQKVDIWNVGVMTWDLFQRGNLFYAKDSSKQNSDTHHLAEMIALLGPPPMEMIQSSSYATEFFDSQGKWKGAVSIPSTILEDLEGNWEGAQQEMFLAFLRKMLCWRPEDRKFAGDLLSDPWLRSL